MAQGDPVWRGAAVVCLIGGLAAMAVLSAFGRWQAGLAVGLGLMLGSVNGFLARRTLTADVGVHVGSLGRLAALSMVAIVLAWPLGFQNAPLLIGGVAAAQLVLALVAALVAVESAR
jgi:hypothetical protein